VNLGSFRDGHPRITLTFPSAVGNLLIEFLVDTGFGGDLAVPQSVISRLDASFIGPRDRRLADGTPLRCAMYATTVDWNGEDRATEVLVFPCEPLLGTIFLQDYLLQVEVVEGGSVEIGSLS